MVTTEQARRPRVFYGWYILGVAMLAAFLAAGSSQLFMSIMLKPMTDDFGWSRTATTGAITLGTILAGLVAPVFGRLADRHGPRLLMTLGALLLAGSYFALAQLGELWQFYAVYVTARGLTTPMLTGVVPMTAATNWFRRMRGRALGFIAMCTPLGGAVLAFSGELIIESASWQTVFIVFAMLTLTLLVVPAAMLLRRTPEEMGLLPDGAPSLPPATAAPTPPTRGHELSWTLSEALRTPTLWLITAAGVVAAMANTAVGFHLVAYYTDVGLPATEAVTALSVYAFSGAIASGLWGWFTERLSERMMAVVVSLLSAGAIMYLLWVRDLLGAIAFAVLFGLTSRGGSTLTNIILAQYFGRRAYGTISGFVNPFTMVGLGLGPTIGALCFDLTGSYHVEFTFFAVASVVTAGLIWLARHPGPPPHHHLTRTD
ncbi:MAG TPA: MFS transporter [Chloroflexota bacterium]|nr:MFS transporter [Chloroflexota bacterium]